MAPQYTFLTRWRVKASAEEVFDVLADPLALAKWWPSVYLEVHELQPGDPATGRGRVIDLYTKGWLPYTLRWNFTVTESSRPSGFKLVAHGDFEGTGVWTIRQDGEVTEAVYDWRISAEKPLLRYGSFILRPIFAANHRWAMARGLESLELELRRRRATTDAERASIPPPPAATFRR
jgi:Polyketide cyclase / dehydrase and lipid transport